MAAEERLPLDRREPLPGKEDAPMPEVEAAAEMAAGGGGDGGCDGGESEALLVAELSDHQIQEKVQRVVGLLSLGMGGRLPDKGVKLRAHLRQLHDELDRRKLAPHRKNGGECDRAAQSITTESSGTIKDSNENLTISESHSQPSFASQFLHKLQSKADAAPNKNLRDISLNKCGSSREVECPVHERRQPIRISSQPARMSSRDSPFLCASTLASKDEQRSSNGDLKSLESFSTSHLGEKLSNLSSRKRRASDTRDSLELKSKKVQEVVLLDEEVQPVQPMQIDDPDKWKEAKIYYPLRDDPESVEISYADLKCLEPESYLSSPIMNFYIQYLQRPVSPMGRPRGEYYFFNTYFYRKLEEALSCKGDRNSCFLKLRRWWKGVNIFQKAYIFLPIHGDWHWSLVIISIPAKEDESGPIILHLDSLGIHSSNSVFDVVGRYLKEEWNYINQNAYPPDVPISERIWKYLPRRIEKKKINVPQQKNEYDCGLFVLYFMERFIEEAPERLRKKDLAMFGRKWFQPEDASGLRKRIRDLLLEVFESAKMENGRIEPATSSGSSPEL
ncbi:ubiquitin-like-specific protease 1D isoform X2 [Phoenix dactylifera]|uniref:Ubiquitin-like-specific protease 1D isoform X2 n=1 Tax=Phoenix dactylifera TaxID=42345 RepID=A0A8B7BYE1_PHODC|nr:ubiquitin-like-specific protease 1D isoform X2 [Phoenix dactylifera]